MASFNLVEHLYGRQFSPPRGSMGYPRVLSPHRRPYPTRDGYICLMPYTDAQWSAFFQAAGAGGTAADPRFATMAARTVHIDALYELAADLISQQTSHYWLAKCDEIGVPAAPALSLEALMDDAHLKSVGFFTELQDPGLGNLVLPGVPVLFDGERPPVAAPPRLGEHNNDVFGVDGPAAHGWRQARDTPVNPESR
jgi:crotonobetainyl-CoA:carnitine CoA-transferase CaiB-like acyl-CoA transferase